MKIRTRLAFAFCIIIFVPFVTVFMAYALMVIYNFANETHYTSETMLKLQDSISGLSLDVIVSVALILILTATILILWIYKGIVPNIRKLTKAADRIKEGDLEFSIAGNGVDELSELCDTFEEMRMRLKSNADRMLIDEEERQALLANIAHDLKTPLSSIKGYSEGLIDGVADTPLKQQEYVKTIYNKAVEMDNLINELTFISNLDTKMIPYNFQKVNVTSYFQECTCNLSMELSHKNVQLTYSGHIEEEVRAIIDCERLDRVINNIINNSIKYKKDNLDLIIAINLYDIGDYVQVDIADNGIGIVKDDLPYIFDRMFRSDKSRNTAVGGSGIGLSIVKRIIEDHGGTVWAASTLDRGTKISFTLQKCE